ncbi:hypothetical protein [Streptomyces odontomachi]|uniref:hypothetical protein n=1 Tax=Streptomyces odontomachi TaxID=2944940 RepID=UPI0021090B22|nr:hypothetical protein [Streptomyces sp. ODS25]
MPELKVEIDGQLYPLRACFWVLFDPANCAVGSEHGDLAVDSEQSHRNFTPRQRDRDRQTRQGYRIELLTRQQWGEQAKSCFYGTCTHHKAPAA